MNERQTHLKIKVKHLAAEARINRAEARKVTGDARWNLNDHRTSVIRPAARINLLAYGLLRGVPYAAMEARCYEPPSFHAVERIAARFGAPEEAIAAWVAEAQTYLKGQLEKAA